MADKLSGFAPIVNRNAKLLILGSMPSVQSLSYQQYYAHPQNAFWYIMGQLYGAEPELEYNDRIKYLHKSDVAVWDVLKHCQRKGSLDANIEYEEVNDFPGFFSQYPKLRKIGFNGQKAFQIFNQRVLKVMGDSFRHLELIQLPSTSPAMATLNKEQKCCRWKQLLA